MKPSPRSQISGFDNILVDGQESIAELISMIKHIESDKGVIEKVTKRMRNFETYIKTNYVMRCSTYTNCISHCSICALSDITDKSFYEKCSVKHTHSCSNCEDLVEFIRDIEKNVEKLQRRRS